MNDSARIESMTAGDFDVRRERDGGDAHGTCGRFACTLFTVLATLYTVLALICGPGSAHAQRPPAQLDAGEILHRMHKLEVVGSVLYVAAHPDDENTRLISYLSNGVKVRTAYLSLTRGDGGQNLIGPELGDALGIIRTQELLEARRIDGGEQFFTRAVDFGYSKSAEETFEKWGKQEVLGDVVRVIRTFRPDVIITRFAPDGSGGHGHHTASSILANEAFTLAADPQAFPEQNLAPWQVKRLFFNGSTWWRKDLDQQAANDPAKWLKVDVGGYDPLLGASYSEIAGRSRSQHKSQGFGAAETRGEQLEYLRLEQGLPLTSADIFDGIDISWTRVESGAAVPAALHALIASYEPSAPEKSVPQLIAIVDRLDALAQRAAERSWPAFKAEAARELILQACGVVVESTAPDARSARGARSLTPGTATVSVLQRRAEPKIAVVGIGEDDHAVSATEQLEWNRPLERDLVLANGTDSLTGSVNLEVGSAVPTYDQPYWLVAPHDTLYHPNTAHAWGIEPTIPGDFTTVVKLRVDDALPVRVSRSTMNKWVDRVAGERMQPVVPTPVASIGVGDGILLVRGQDAGITVEVEALTDELSGTLTATVPDGWSIVNTPDPIQGLARGQRKNVRFDVRREADAQRGVMHVTFAGPSGTSNRTLHVIDYPHILPQTWYTPADVQLIPLDVAVNVKTVGYIDGAGDDIPQALEQLGVTVVRIDPATAHAAELAKCDSIVTGIRAYNTVKSLPRFQPTLLEYVEKGGTLVVQYNTNGNDLVMDAKRIGPYPFSLTRSRVTVEEAPPTFLAQAHPLMHVPNELNLADFDGWVQERGLYFAGDVDPKYTALIAWNDPGESPLTGGLIACDFGKGRFIYTGISLFRQLPAGVAGSYRLLANLIARRTGGE